MFVLLRLCIDTFDADIVDTLKRLLGGEGAVDYQQQPSTCLHIEAKVNVNYIGLHLLDESQPATNGVPLLLSSRSSATCISAVLRGALLRVQTTSAATDYLGSIKLGYCAVYGVGDIRVLSVGKESAKETDPEVVDLDDMAIKDLALSVSMQLLVSVDGDSIGSVKNNPARATSILDARRECRHVVTEVTVNVLRCIWDKESLVLFMSTLHKNNLLLTTYTTAKQDVAFAELKILCASLSMSKEWSKHYSKVKWSSDIVLKGMEVEIPLTSSPAVVGLDRVGKGLKLGEEAGRRLILRFGLLSARGGDFLAPRVRSSVSDIPVNRPAFSVDSADLSVEDSIQALLASLKCDAVDPVEIDLLEVQLIVVSRDEERPLTETPWRVRSILSPCSIPAHSLYPKLRVDTFCSEFRVAFAFEVCAFVCDLFGVN